MIHKRLRRLRKLRKLRRTMRLRRHRIFTRLKRARTRETGHVQKTTDRLTP
jgi:hypothetical protein